MSCYFRYMKDILEKAGIEVTKANKKDIDRVIHDMVGVDYKNCSPAWKAIKDHIRDDDKARNTFIKGLKVRLKGS